MSPGKVKHLTPPLSFWFEALAAFGQSAVARVRTAYRGLWFYRCFLKGQLCDSIAFAPQDGAPNRLEAAGALLRGRFTFGGETVDVTYGSVFDKPAPSQQWFEALHSFAWLAPLSVNGGEAARKLATDLIAQWGFRYTRFSGPVFRPELVARRLIRLFAHARFVVVSSDLMWRSQLFVSMREQTKLLARTVGEAPEGLPRIEAAAALAISGLALEDHAATWRLSTGLARLEGELFRQILPDGGHISRSPQALVDAYRLVVLVTEGLTAKGWAVPDWLSGAQSRMAPMIRFFRHGDGGLAAFNGGGQGDAGAIGWLLSQDPTRGKSPVEAPQSGYCRLTAGHTLVLMDCGGAPPPAFSTAAHAGPLSFELSSGQNRIVVNCGTASGAQYREWERPLRSTAAHSTATLADLSAAMFLREGWMRRLLGGRLYYGAKVVPVRREEDARGWTVTAGHDAYVRTFAVHVERSMTLSPQGLALSGTDRFFPTRKFRAPVPFAVRFHVHPDVRLSPAPNGSILLKLPNGEGWRFRAGLAAAIEESISFGETLRRAEQIVLAGAIVDRAVEVSWVFEQIGA